MLEQPIQILPAYGQLTPAERAFVDAYLADMEQSAIKAGERLATMLGFPVAPNMSARWRAMLDKPLVRAAVNERAREITESMELSAGRVLRETAAIAFANMANYIEIPESGTPFFDISKCSPEQLSAIKKIEIEELPRGGRKFKFELHDKLNAIGKLMQYMGLTEPGNTHWATRARDMDKGANKTAALPVDSSTADAADAWARMIGD